jgi:hypothetical protein
MQFGILLLQFGILPLQFSILPLQLGILPLHLGILPLQFGILPLQFVILPRSLINVSPRTRTRTTYNTTLRRQESSKSIFLIVKKSNTIFSNNFYPRLYVSTTRV